MDKELKIPYKDLLPPLSTEEYEALKQSIANHGIEQSILIDEDDNILDGHNRYSIDKNAPVRIIEGLSETEKQATVIERNWSRRNLSPDQKKELRKKQKKIAVALKKEGMTQKEIGGLMGVARETIKLWLQKNESNGKNTITFIPDSRIKINTKHKPIIIERIDRGETKAQVAADYGITQQRIGQIVKQEKKVSEEKEKREVASNKRKGNNSIECLDFRTAEIPDESIDMIFTDPPYDKEHVSVYQDIANMAVKALVPGGWLLTYSGHVHLPEIYKAFSETEGLEYAWTFAILHKGGDTRFRKYQLMVGWKPIIAMYKPPLSIHWDWFKDVVSGGKEKTDHEWQQALLEAEHFIDHLCPKNGLVLDPCCGSGTTLLAAKNLSRKWLGYEIDIDTVEKARQKLDD